MTPRVSGLVSGVLAALSLPPFHFWPLVFVALVPLAFTLAREGVTRADASWAGVGFGAGFYGLLLHWVPFTMSGVVPLGSLIGSLGVFVLVGVAGLQGMLLRELLRRRSRGSCAPVLILPAIWVTVEWFLAAAGPLAVPWTPLGLALAPAPEVASVAEWVGVRGLGLWIATVNGIFVVAVRAPSARFGIRWSGVALLAFLLPSSAGTIRTATLEVDALPPILVGWMTLDRNGLLDPERRDLQVSRALTRMAEGVGEAVALMEPSRRPVVALLPEAPFGSTMDGEVEEELMNVARTLGMPLLAGAHVVGARGRENAIVLLEASGGSRAVHGKRRLVPGVERPGLVPGEPSSVLSLGGVGLAFAVCFESAFSSDVRALRRAGADLLANPTNDAWYSPSLSGGLSAAHHQHRAHLVLRAIETRMGAVRSPIGGELLVVAPTGRITRALPPGGEGFDLVNPSGSSVVPTYVRTGDLAGPAAALLLFGLLAAGRSRSRSGRTRDRAIRGT